MILPVFAGTRAPNQSFGLACLPRQACADQRHPRAALDTNDLWIRRIRAQHPVESNRQLSCRRHFRHSFRFLVAAMQILVPKSLIVSHRSLMDCPRCGAALREHGQRGSGIGASSAVVAVERLSWLRSAIGQPCGHNPKAWFIRHTTTFTARSFTNLEEQMRVAIYARVSTANNGQDPAMQTRGNPPRTVS